MKLALDHHYSTRIAEQLRDRGIDAVAAVEAGWQELSDDQLLEECAAEGRALVTNNVADFAVIIREWEAQGRSAAGLVFTSDGVFPRAKRGIGPLVRALEALVRDAAAGGIDDVVWLRPVNE